MTFLIGFLLVILVGGYIAYPLFAKEIGQRHVYTEEELQNIGEGIEREILALRKYPDQTKT